MHGDSPLPGFEYPDFAAEIVATTGALIVVLDRRGRIIAFNPACERLTGYRFAEVQGRTCWELFLLDDEMARVRAVFADICAGRFPPEPTSGDRANSRPFDHGTYIVRTYHYGETITGTYTDGWDASAFTI